MLTRKSSLASGVRVFQYQWGMIVRGTREMLVQHEITQDGLFPGDDGAQGKQRHTCIDPAGRKIRIYRKSKYQFEVWRDWTEQEADAYAKQIEREEEIECATSRVARWPKSCSKYRELVLTAFSTWNDALEDAISAGIAGGYRYSDDVILRCRILVDQLVDQLETGGIVKDLELRERHTPACIAKTVRAADAARRDRDFQKWMHMQGMVTK